MRKNSAFAKSDPPLAASKTLFLFPIWSLGGQGMVGDMVVFVCVCVYGGGFGAKQLQTTHDTCTRQLAFTFIIISNTSLLLRKQSKNTSANLFGRS